MKKNQIKTTCNYILLFWMSLNLIFPYPVFSLPQNGSVASGQVDMQQSANLLNIHQQTNKAIINWNSFSIGSDERVRFIQPGVHSALLNRVTGTQTSLIEGFMHANGNVFLINPNGILVGPSGVIQTHGFIGSTLDISNQDFLNGTGSFTLHPGTPLGSIINRGLIQANDSGYVSLLSPTIENHGTIMAHMGKIHLAAGEKITLSFIENDLVGFAIDPEDLPETSSQKIDASINNFGNIQADGGEMLISARVAGDLVHAVVNNEGIIEAHSLVNDQGVIRLESSHDIQNSGNLDVSGRQSNEKGGNIQVTGETIVMTGSATLDASGDAGGGNIWIGGGLNGKDTTIQNAQNTFVGKDTSIHANATGQGDGGQVVVWADGSTLFSGDISAKGGTISGDGGFVEVSGKENLFFNGSVSTRAPLGKNGTLLLDPENIYIVDGDTDDLDPDFNGNVNFSDIPAEMTIAETRLESLSSDTDIKLQANNRISMMDLTDNELTLNQTGSVEMSAGGGGFIMNATDTINITGGGNLIIDALGSENGAYPATDGPIALGTIRTVGIGGVIIQGTTINLLGPIDAGGTVTIENRDLLTIQRNITAGGAFLQKGPRPVSLGGNITATDEISFTHNISLTRDAIRMLSRDGSIFLMNSKIVEGVSNCALILGAESVVSLGDVDISALIFENMNGGLILNGDVQLASAFDTTSVLGLLYVDDAASIRTNGKKVLFNTAVSLKAPLTIHTGDSSGDITFNDRVDGQFMLDLTAGTGNVLFQQDVGKKTMIDGLSIRSSQNVTFMDDLLSNSAVDIYYSSLFSQGGAIRTTGDNILLHGNVLLTNDAVYDTTTGGGDIHIFGNINSQTPLDQTIEITAGTGDITIEGAIGNTSIPGDIHIMSANDLTVKGLFQANSLLHPSGTGTIEFKDTLTTYDGGIHLHGQKILLNNILNSNSSPVILAADAFLFPEEIRALDSSVTLYPHSASIKMGVEDYTRDLNITNNQLNILKTSQIVIGHVDNTGGMSIAIDNTISQNKQLQFISSGPITIQGTIVTGNNSKLIVTNYSDLNIAPGARLTLDGGWLQEGDGQVYIGGSMTTTNDDILFNGPVRLTGNLALDTGLELGHIQFSDKLDGNYYLSAKSGLGNIVFGDQVGAEIPLNGLSLTSSADIEIASQFHSGSMTITNNGTLRFTSGADIQLNNAFLQQGIGPVSLAGKITTSNENITFTQPVTLIGNAVLSTGSGPGNILFNNTVNGLHVLTMNAGTGDIKMVEKVGSLAPILGLVIQSGRNVSFLSEITVDHESIDITAQNISITAPITTQNGGLLAFENTSLLTLSEDAVLTLDGAFWQRSAGPVQLSTDIVTTGDEIKIEGPLTCTRDIRFDTGGDSDGTILLNGGITSDHLITINSGLGNVTLGQAISTEGINIQSSNVLTINGDLQVKASGLDINAQSIAINNNIQTSNQGSIRLSNDQALNISSDSLLTVDGSFTQTGDGWVNLGGTIQTNGQPIEFSGNITLIGPVQLTSGLNGGNIVLGGTIDSAKNSIYSLSLDSGQGNIAFNGDLGMNDLFDVTVLSAQDVLFNAPSRLNTYIQESGTGLTQFKDTLYLGAGGFSFKGNHLTLEKNIDTASTLTGIGMLITNQGLLTIAPLSKITLSGDFQQTGVGNISLGGNILTSSADITIESPIILSNDASLRSIDEGNITIQQTVNGHHQLILASGSGDLVLASAIGGETALKGLTVENAGNIQLNVPITTQDNGIHLNGLTIQPSGSWITDGGDISVIGNTELSGDIQWNTGNGPGNIQVQGQMNGLSNYEQSMTLRAGTGNINVQGAIGEQIPVGNMDIQSATHVTIQSNIIADGLKQTSIGGETQFLGTITTKTGGIQLQNKRLTLQGNIDSNGKDIVLIADQMTLPLSIKATGARVQLAPITENTPIGINHPEQTLVFDDATLDKIDTDHLIFGSYAYNGDIFVGQNAASEFGQDKDLSFITNGNINISGKLSTTLQKSVTIDHGKDLIVQADLSLDGSFEETGNGKVYWSGNLQTTGDAVTFYQPITLIGDSQWQTQNGLLTVHQTIDGNYDLNINAGSGQTLFSNAIGNTTRLNALTVLSSMADMHGIHTGIGGVTLSANTIQLNGNISTLQGNILLTGQTKVMADIRMDTSGGKITFAGSLLDDEQARKITLATGDGAISLQKVTIGMIEFEPGGVLTLSDTIDVKNEWDTSKVGNILLKNDITIQTHNADISLKNAIDGHYALVLNTGEENIGYVYLSGVLGGKTALKSLSVLDSAGCFIDGSIVTANGNILFKRSVVLSDALSINTGTGIGNVRFEDNVYSMGDISRNLQINTGGGNITFLRAVGPNTPLGTVSVQQAGNIYIQDSFRAENITMTPFQNLQLGGSMTSTNGNITINGNIATTQNQLHLNSTNGDITISGKIDAQNSSHTLIFNANTGKIDINDVSMGEMQINAADSGLYLHGDIIVDERFDTSNIAGPIVLKNHTSISTRNTGYIVLTPSIDGPFQFLVNSNGGTVRIDRPIGQGHKVQTFIVSSAETVLLGDNIYTSTGKISMNGNVTLLKDNISLNSVIGDIVLNNRVDDADNDFQLNIMTAAGNIYLKDVFLSGIQLEAPNNGLFLNGDIQLTNGFDTTEIDGPISIQAPVLIQTQAQDVVLNTDIVLNANLRIDTGSSAGSIRLNGAVNGNHQLTVSAGTGDIRFQKSIGALDTISKLSILSGKSVRIDSSIKTHGTIQMDHTGSISLYGNLQTIDTGASIVISDANMTLFGNRSMTTQNGNIVLDGLQPSTHGQQNLVLNAGTGNISIDHAIGHLDKAFADIQIIAAKDIHLMGAETTVNARSFKIDSSTGGVRFDGRLTLSGDLSLNVHLLQINAMIETTGKITIANSDEATLVADIQTSGDVHFTGTGKIELDGDIDIQNPGSCFQVDRANLSLRDSHHIRTNNGNIELFSISTENPGANMLNLTAGTGTIQVNGPVGRADQILGGIHVIDAGNVRFAETDETLYANTLWIQSVDSETAFDGPVRINGDIDISTNSLSILSTMETRSTGNIAIETKGQASIDAPLISAGNIQWQQTGDVHISQNISSQGNIALSGAGTIHLDADISISGIGATLLVNTATLLLKGDHQLSTVNGDILLNTVATDTSDDHILTLSAGNGDIQILKDVGTDIARMGGLVISDANEVAFSGESASVNVNTLSIHNKNILTIKSDIRSTGKLTFSGAGTILLSADLETTGLDADISILYSTVQLMENCAIISHQGDIQLANILPQNDGSAALQLDANNNQIFLNGKVGESGKALSGLNIVQADQIHVNGNIHISGDMTVNARILTVNQPIETVGMGEMILTISEQANIHSRLTSEGTIQFGTSGAVVLGADIQTTTPNADILFNTTPLILTDNSRLETQGGNIQLAAITPETDKKPVLTLAAERGDIVFNGPVGTVNQSLSDIRVASAHDIHMASNATAIYTDRLTIQQASGQTLIDTPLYVADDVLIKSATLTLNANIQFKANADITIITSGLTTLNADLQVPGNILFDGRGDIVLASNIETTVDGAWIKSPDAPLIISGNHSLITRQGPIELHQIGASQLTDQLTINPTGNDVIVHGYVGKSDKPLYGLSIQDAANVSFLSQTSTIYASDHLNVEASGLALFEGDVTVQKTIQMNVNELNIRSQMIVAQDVTFDILGDLTVMGLQTNGKGDITLISQTGQMILGDINAGNTGNLYLTALKNIDGGTLHAKSIAINAATIGLTIPPLLDTQNFQASLTGSPETPFIGHIKMAKPDANLPKQEQIKYLGDGLSVFLVDSMTIYGLEGKDRPFYPLPILSYRQHTLIHDAFEGNNPEFFMAPPLNVDISLEDDKEIQFLEMNSLF
ncbi:MAG: filamentous hemagglutinin N-terminal domain-containing protein [Candidatus Magnetomorum sp.]|nr:filamentous hemagglutinin N-terminal domain-containing protein [Candidatus Magnetomorum sp.]